MDRNPERLYGNKRTPKKEIQEYDVIYVYIGVLWSHFLGTEVIRIRYEEDGDFGDLMLVTESFC